MVNISSDKLILSTIFNFTEKQPNLLAISLGLTFNYGKFCGGGILLNSGVNCQSSDCSPARAS